MTHPDFLLRSYAFHLPPDRVAQRPATRREDSRLMILDRRRRVLMKTGFSTLLSHLSERCLLVANNSRVIPARLYGTRPHGGAVEALLLTPPPLLRPESDGSGGMRAEAEALLRPAKKVREGDLIRVADDLALDVISRGPFGRFRVRLAWRGDILEVLRGRGSVPLPGYIGRRGGMASGDWGTDAERYQTVYARDDKAGSVAAPTAGLHFSEETRAALLASGREWASVTLYVGYGTFSPVRCEDIREHRMHAEYIEVPEESAAAVNRAKAEGRAVIAVGTTSCRALEGAHAALHPQAAAGAFAGLSPFAGETDIFFYPGKAFHCADGLLTNFHLPESSLLMLVAAFAGRERVLHAYEDAIASGFRFYSYGDAMLIQ